MYIEREIPRIDTAKNLIYGIISKHSRNKTIEKLNKVKDNLPITGRIEREVEAKTTIKSILPTSEPG